MENEHVSSAKSTHLGVSRNGAIAKIIHPLINTWACNSEFFVNFDRNLKRLRKETCKNVIINDSVVSRKYLIIKSCLVVNMLKCTAVCSCHGKKQA